MKQHFASVAMVPLAFSTLLILTCAGSAAASVCTDCHSEITLRLSRISRAVRWAMISIAQDAMDPHTTRLIMWIR